MDATTPKKLVETYFKAISESRFADAASCFDARMQLWIVGEGHWDLGGSHDHEGVLEIHKRVRERFPGGLHVTLHKIIADGEDVAVECETLGTRVDGRIYNNRYIHIFVVRDGKIVGRREYLDTIHAQDLLCGPMAPPI